MQVEPEEPSRPPITIDGDPRPLRIPAVVLGVLGRRTIEVILAPEAGMGGVPHTLSLDVVPFDLRIPNSRFVLVREQDGSERVERRNDPGYG